MSPKGTGLLKAEGIKSLVTRNPGITNAMIAQHYKLDARATSQWVAKHLVTAKWLFVQLRGSTKHYYLASYAEGRNISKRIASKKRKSNSKWDHVVENERVKYLKSVKRLSAMWKVPKGAV